MSGAVLNTITRALDAAIMPSPSTTPKASPDRRPRIAGGCRGAVPRQGQALVSITTIRIFRRRRKTCNLDYEDFSQGRHPSYAWQCPANGTRFAHFTSARPFPRRCLSPRGAALLAICNFVTCGMTHPFISDAAHVPLQRLVLSLVLCVVSARMFACARCARGMYASPITGDASAARDLWRRCHSPTN